MKLHCDPAATSCRPILLFAAEHGMDLDLEAVSLPAGEHLAAAFGRINPNHQVPVLDDDGFVLTEASAILKYLADLVRSPTYPSDLRPRARVNEAMDWFATGFHRDFCLGAVYGQILPSQRWDDPAMQARAVHRALGRAGRRLEVLDRHMLAASPFLCGYAPTIADYLGAAMVSLGDAVGFDLSPYPRVTGWMRRMRALPGWKPSAAAFEAAIAAREETARAA
jgi:glutathione S-transferase